MSGEKHDQLRLLRCASMDVSMEDAYGRGLQTAIAHHIADAADNLIDVKSRQVLWRVSACATRGW